MSSRPVFNLIRTNNSSYAQANRQANTQANLQGGSFSNASKDGDEELYKYKAKKYHHKIQSKLGELKHSFEQQNPGKSWVCPSGYDKYLQPFQG
jgi:uncharacterized protein YukJ